MNPEDIARLITEDPDASPTSQELVADFIVESGVGIIEKTEWPYGSIITKCAC